MAKEVPHVVSVRRSSKIEILSDDIQDFSGCINSGLSVEDYNKDWNVASPSLPHVML